MKKTSQVKPCKLVPVLSPSLLIPNARIFILVQPGLKGKGLESK